MTDDKTIIIKGAAIKVVSDEEAEKTDFLVCMPWGSPSPFSDNFKGVCSHCGCDVMYRWHAPRQPKRICIDCLQKRAERERP